jgi:hypothetical protein
MRCLDLRPPGLVVRGAHSLRATPARGRSGKQTWGARCSREWLEWRNGPPWWNWLFHLRLKIINKKIINISTYNISIHYLLWNHYLSKRFDFCFWGTVNQLLFTCEKISRVLRQHPHCEYFLSWNRSSIQSLTNEKLLDHEITCCKQVYCRGPRNNVAANESWLTVFRDLHIHTSKCNVYKWILNFFGHWWKINDFAVHVHAFV